MEEVMLYDISGNLAYKKDKNGNELRYTYDTDDNLINVWNARRQSKGRNRFIQPDVTESYEYNPDGTLKKAMSKGGYCTPINMTNRNDSLKNRKTAKKYYNINIIKMVI